LFYFYIKNNVADIRLVVIVFVCFVFVANIIALVFIIIMLFLFSFKKKWCCSYFYRI